MRFVKTIDHALEIAYKCCPNGTEIHMYKHKKGDKKANYNVKKVSDF